MISVTLKKESFSALKQQIILKPLTCVQYGQVLGSWAETESNRYCDTCIAVIKMLDLCSCVLFGKITFVFLTQKHARSFRGLLQTCFQLPNVFETLAQVQCQRSLGKGSSIISKC